MSSQIIGELGQVGLTVPKRETKVEIEHPEEQISISEPNKSDECALKRPAKNLNYRVKKFRREWMMFDIFKDWLRPHATSAELAHCTACNRTIKAGKSELEKHATGKKHLSMLKPQLESQTTVDLVQSNTSPPEELNFSTYTVELSENGASSQEGDQPFLPELPKTATPMTPEPFHFTGKAFVTRHAPHWKATAIVNGHVTTLDLNDYAERYLILVFYPNDFCKISASEVNALSDAANELRTHGIDIVACSVDSHHVHLAWCRVARRDGGVAGTKIALLADPTHAIANAYGVYLQDKGHTLRAHFLIDKRGIIRHISVNDTPFGRGIAELIRMSKAVLYNENTEESCPVDWQPA